MAHRIAGAYLAQRTLFGMKFGLETMRTLVEALGHPERAYPSLLIAGTNGKGSVAAYVDSALRASGLRTGRYTSPHLVRINERITVGGREIKDAAFARAVMAVRDAAAALVKRGTLAAHPTFFEAVTAAALWHFARAHVDVAVLEVGLGGRLDATNVVEPVAAAIVSIDYDHQAYLGDTLDSIAREKAGVLRPKRATVLGPLPAEARDAIVAVAKETGARLVDARKGARLDESSSRGGELVSLATPRGRYEGMRPLPGAHQRDNLLVAVRLLEEAKTAGLAVDLGALPEATARTRWPGRLQLVPGDPPILLDGAHNPAGARALAAHLASGPPFVLLFGAMSDKDVPAVAQALFPLARAVVLTRPKIARAATPDELAARAGALARDAHKVATVPRALARARRLAKERGHGTIVVVAGSLYLVGAVSDALARRGERRSRRDTLRD